MLTYRLKPNSLVIRIIASVNPECEIHGIPPRLVNSHTDSMICPDSLRPTQKLVTSELDTETGFVARGCLHL